MTHSARILRNIGLLFTLTAVLAGPALWGLSQNSQLELKELSQLLPGDVSYDPIKTAREEDEKWWEDLRQNVNFKPMGRLEMIGHLLLDVKHSQWGEGAELKFYNSLGQNWLTMQDVLEFKSTVTENLGMEGLCHFLGPMNEHRSTPVEQRLVYFRMVESLKAAEYAVKTAMNRFGHPQKKVYVGFVGSWAQQLVRQFKFEDDVDISFLSNAFDFISAVKGMFAEYILNKFKMDPLGLDSVPTEHGRGGPEVYVGSHGRMYGEDQFNKGGVIIYEFRPDGSCRSKNAREALIEMMTEEDLSTNRYEGTKAITEFRYQREPGLSMEMIRHLVHDIRRSNAFTPMAKLIKSAKYVKRVLDAHIAEFAKHPQFSDADILDLVMFAEDIHDLSRDSTVSVDRLVTEITDFFNGRSPIGVDVRTDSKGRRVAVSLSTDLLVDFYRDCDRLMWSVVEDGLRLKMETLRHDVENFRNASFNSDDNRRLAQDLIWNKFRAIEDMLAQEELVFARDRTEIPLNIRLMIEDVRAMSLSYAGEFNMRPVGPEDLKETEFLKEMIKSEAGRTYSVALTMKRMLDGVLRGYNWLDFLDDAVLDELRKSEEFRALEGDPLIVRAGILSADDYKSRMDLYKGLKNTTFVKYVTQINEKLNFELQKTTPRKLFVGAVQGVNIVTEALSYYSAWTQEKTVRGKMAAVAREFFIRHVPFGGLADKLVVSDFEDYYGAAWEVVVTLIPPIAIGQAALNIASWLLSQTVQYVWDSRLEAKENELYGTATFTVVPGSIKTIADIKTARWQLYSVRHKDRIYYRIPPKEEKVEWTLQDLLDEYEMDHLLKKTIASVDPAMREIEEVFGHELIPEELRVRFRTTNSEYKRRWALVKNEFLTKLTTRLEERWTNEHIVAGGGLDSLAQDLRNTAKELELSDEILAAMRSECSSWSASRNLATIFAQGYELVFGGDHDAAITEVTGLFRKYAEFYGKVLDARNQLEERLQLKNTGVRMLTGPYFLSGNWDKDQDAVQQWAGLLLQTERDMSALMKEKKAHYIESAALDSAYDKEMLGKIYEQEAWRRVWTELYKKHEALASKAVVQAKSHDQERDRLFGEYEQHYAASGLLIEIKIFVTDEYGSPLGGALVNLEGAAGLLTAETEKTEGLALIRVREPKIYTAVVRAYGYSPKRAELNLSPTGPGDRIFRMELGELENPGAVQAPILIGETREDAQRILIDLGIAGMEEVAPEQFHRDYDPGVIVIQDPPEPGEVLPGEKIRVVFNPTRVTVPPLAGIPRAEAVELLRHWGLEPGRIKEVPFDNTYGAGEVVKQYRAGGETVDVKTAVDLDINPDEAPVPVLESFTLSASRTELTAVGEEAGLILKGFFSDNQERDLPSSEVDITSSDTEERILVLAGDRIRAVGAGEAELTALYRPAPLAGRAVLRIRVNIPVEDFMPEFEILSMKDDTSVLGDCAVGDVVKLRILFPKKAGDRLVWRVDTDEFGGGKEPRDEVTYTFASEGRFTFDLIVYRGGHSYRSDYKGIVVSAVEREVDFSYTPVKERYEEGETIRFSNASDPALRESDLRWMTRESSLGNWKAAARSWDFDFTLPGEGTYYVRLEILHEGRLYYKNLEAPLNAAAPETQPFENWRGGDRNEFRVSLEGGRLKIEGRVFVDELNRPGEWTQVRSLESGRVKDFLFENAPIENLSNAGYILYQTEGGALKYMLLGLSGEVSYGAEKKQAEPAALRCFEVAQAWNYVSGSMDMPAADARMATITWKTKSGNTFFNWEGRIHKYEDGLFDKKQLGSEEGYVEQEILIDPERGLTDKHTATIRVSSAKPSYTYNWKVFVLEEGRRGEAVVERSGAASVRRHFEAGEYEAELLVVDDQNRSHTYSRPFTVTSSSTGPTEEDILSYKPVVLSCERKGDSVHIRLGEWRSSNTYLVEMSPGGGEVTSVSGLTSAVFQFKASLLEPFRSAGSDIFTFLIREKGYFPGSRSVRLPEEGAGSEIISIEIPPPSGREVDSREVSVVLTADQSGSPRDVYYVGKTIQFTAAASYSCPGCRATYDWYYKREKDPDWRLDGAFKGQSYNFMLNQPGTLNIKVEFLAEDQVNRNKVFKGEAGATVRVELDPAQPALNPKFTYSPQVFAANTFTSKVVTVPDPAGSHKEVQKTYTKKTSVTFKVSSHDPEGDNMYWLFIGDVSRGLIDAREGGPLEFVYDGFDDPGIMTVRLEVQDQTTKVLTSYEEAICVRDPRTMAPCPGLPGQPDLPPGGGEGGGDAPPPSTDLTSPAAFEGPESVKAGETGTFTLLNPRSEKYFEVGIGGKGEYYRDPKRSGNTFTLTFQKEWGDSVPVYVSLYAQHEPVRFIKYVFITGEDEDKPVQPPPSPELEFTGPASVTFGESGEFTIAHYSSDLKYLWDFGGISETGEGKTHTYTFSRPIHKDQTVKVTLRAKSLTTGETIEAWRNVEVRSASGPALPEPTPPMPILIGKIEAAPEYGPYCYRYQWSQVSGCRPFDSQSDNRASLLMVYEDGQSLGPPHSNHMEIGKAGKGRFSHWLNYLLFSTSDNTDPRTNGRTYTFRCVGEAPVEGFPDIGSFIARMQKYARSGDAEGFGSHVAASLRLKMNLGPDKKDEPVEGGKRRDMIRRFTGRFPGQDPDKMDYGNIFRIQGDLSPNITGLRRLGNGDRVFRVAFLHDFVLPGGMTEGIEMGEVEWIWDITTDKDLSRIKSIDFIPEDYNQNVFYPWAQYCENEGLKPQDERAKVKLKEIARTFVGRK